MAEFVMSYLPPWMCFCLDMCCADVGKRKNNITRKEFTSPISPHGPPRTKASALTMQPLAWEKLRRGGRQRRWKQEDTRGGSSKRRYKYEEVAVRGGTE
eukprot:762524-Hanusia_phi.AAC.1